MGLDTEDSYCAFASDDECFHSSSSSGGARQASGSGSLSSLAEELDAASLVREFSRAVVPLTGFVVLYLGVLLEQWILTWDMALGLVFIIIGLSLFKFGLVSGLMPFGESIGVGLPQKASGPLVFLACFLLGILVTFSEPGISSLQLVGALLQGQAKSAEADSEADALLLWLLMPSRSFQLLTAVACGVGLASALGLVRLQYRWSMKPLIFGIVAPLLLLTFLCCRSETYSSTVGLSWDCGAITTGPATVPIVLSLGVGASQSAAGRHKGEDSLDGFGIVTLASLLPVLTVMLYAVLSGEQPLSDAPSLPSATVAAVTEPAPGPWHGVPVEELWQSCRAVGPLVGFLVLVQAVLIREKLKGAWGLAKGMLATLLGLFVFNVGLARGSVPLGEMSGRALPQALDSETLLSRWGLAGVGGLPGQLLVMTFGFVAGFVATVIDLEPCGLGETVERMSGGKFTKRDLVFSVAFGVGVGIILGFAKVLWELSLLLVLGVGYTIALILTIFVDEGLCCVAWDSAGVTTGPVTVPLVLSLGVGICGRVGSTDGFGILACASVCPIISVLAAALVRAKLPLRPQGLLEEERFLRDPLPAEGLELRPH